VSPAADPGLTQVLTQIEADADRIADANAVKRLQRAYGFYVDQAKWDDVADLFAKSGTIEIARDGVYVGQERVRAYLYALSTTACAARSAAWWNGRLCRF
jgi:hypothetical protein